MTVPGIDGLIGAELRAYRAKRKYTRRELAELSGVSETTIERLESGRRSASVGQLHALCKALDVDVRELVNRAVAELGD